METRGDNGNSGVQNDGVEPGDTAADGAAEPGPSPSGRPRKRQPKDELRKLMLETGREILREEGIQTGSTNLTFKRVFDRVERDTGRRLTNASVIKRIWQNQADYQADVLVAIAHDEERPEVADTVAAVQEVLATIDLTTVEGRLAGMSELCRVAGAASRRVMAESTSWPLWVAWRPSPPRPRTRSSGSACAGPCWRGTRPSPSSGRASTAA